MHEWHRPTNAAPRPLPSPPPPPPPSPPSQASGGLTSRFDAGSTSRGPDPGAPPPARIRGTTSLRSGVGSWHMTITAVNDILITMEYAHCFFRSYRMPSPTPAPRSCRPPGREQPSRYSRLTAPRPPLLSGSLPALLADAFSDALSRDALVQCDAGRRRCGSLPASAARRQPCYMAQPPPASPWYERC